MEAVIVTCRTLEKELEQAMKNTGVEYPVLYLESGLHTWPLRLNAKLKETLAKIHAERVLLAMGFCGNAIEGLQTGDYELITPRADDCITLLLGSHVRRKEVDRELSAYYLTHGWMHGERNLWVEYQYTVEKYGEKEAMSIAEMMYAHYRTLALLDTGVEPVESLAEETKIIAETLHLEQRVIPGTLAFMERLLTGPWDEEHFLRKAPGNTVTLEDLHLS